MKTGDQLGGNSSDRDTRSRGLILGGGCIRGEGMWVALRGTQSASPVRDPGKEPGPPERLAVRLRGLVQVL